MTRFWPLLGLSAVFAVLAFACKGDGGTPRSETPASSPAAKTYSQRPEVTISADKKYSAVVETTKGKFTIELRPDIALETVNSFIFLAREGFYNGVTFHRVLPGFVAQGGDPTGTGSGGPGYTLPAEFSDVPFERGTWAWPAATIRTAAAASSSSPTQRSSMMMSTAAAMRRWGTSVSVMLARTPKGAA